MGTSAIQIDASKHYLHEAEPLRYCFTIELGKTLALLGRSGSGKTTLLRLLAGLEQPSKGAIVWPDVITRLSHPFGMVFQQTVLIPHLNVRENLAIGWRLHYNEFRKLWWARTEPSELRQRLDEAIPLLELEPYLSRLPSELSGGQRQRVALGRCLIRRPAVFLLDEPLSHLDLAIALRIRDRLVTCFQRWQSTVVWVTHDPAEAKAVADRVISLDEPSITVTTTSDT
ncbi:MAG: ATP-binding cassette domain-containing protein [Planctomycetia bacterium]|nr:ATP-binding cassette domain-containing protein [Planctomycetia bacterium]